MLLVQTTFPDLEVARRVGRQLVEEKLAACCTVMPGAESIYWWQGKIETAAEVQGILKTREERVEALMLRLRELHPYEVPEIVAIKPSVVLPDYAQWVLDSVRNGG